MSHFCSEMCSFSHFWTTGIAKFSGLEWGLIQSVSRPRKLQTFVTTRSKCVLKSFGKGALLLVFASILTWDPSAGHTYQRHTKAAKFFMLSHPEILVLESSNLEGYYSGWWQTTLICNFAIMSMMKKFWAMNCYILPWNFWLFTHADMWHFTCTACDMRCMRMMNLHAPSV